MTDPKPPPTHEERITELVADVESLRSALSAAAKQVESYRSELARVRERLADEPVLLRNLEQFRDERDELAAKLSAAEAALADMRMQLAEMRPPLTWTSNGEAGDGQNICPMCSAETDEPHPLAVCRKNIEDVNGQGWDAAADAEKRAKTAEREAQRIGAWAESEVNRVIEERNAARRDVERWKQAASCVSPEVLESLLVKLQDVTPLLEQARRVEQARQEGYERGKAER
jgi:hypothetical protein